MKFNILTIFPEIFNVLNHGVISKAFEKNLSINCYDIRENAINKHGQIDGKPYGGGEGMLNVEIHGPHINDKFLLDELQKQGEMFGMLSKNCNPDKWLNEGDTIELGNEKLEVYFCPGHTPGHIIFFNKNSKLALVGDVLFNGSIGRTDLPGGNHQELLESIKNKLWPLGKEIEFIPGHGPNSTFGQERKTNAFVADSILNFN